MNHEQFELADGMTPVDEQEMTQVDGGWLLLVGAVGVAAVLHYSTPAK